MSLYVKTVISSRCKCILVQVGPLIYSFKCNFINLHLVSLSVHCVSLSEEKWLIDPPRAVVEVFLPVEDNKEKEERIFFLLLNSNARLKSSVACEVVMASYLI